MKHNKLLTLSLLVSFLILASASFAQDSFTYGTVSSRPYPAGATVEVPVYINNTVAVAAFDAVGTTGTDGNVEIAVAGIVFDNDMADLNVLNDRFGIQDLGSGKYRFGAVKTDAVDGLDLPVGNGQVATLTFTFVSGCKLGTATIEPTDGEWNGHPVVNNMVASTGDPIDPLDIVNGAVNVIDEAPFITNCPTEPFVVYWNSDPQNVVYPIEADDYDLPCGCDVLNYNLLDGPGDLAGNIYSWNPTGPDVGCHHVIVEVVDRYMLAVTCEFDIEVLNLPPEITCPEYADGENAFHVLMGDLITETVTAIDPDAGPLGMTYSLGTATTAGGSIGATSGIYEWNVPDDPSYIGDYLVEAIVTDGANLDPCNKENADTCYFTITVMPSYRVSIEYKTDDGKGAGVTQGHYHDLSITLDDAYTVMEMGGYDFLISYEHSLGALTFMSAAMGDLLVDGEWEYFTYRFGPFGNCGSACPSGLVRLNAMAETNNGSHVATNFDNSHGFNELAVMTFYVSNDRTYNCSYAPVEWFWIDCGDNTISSKYGDTLFIEREIYTYEGDPVGDPPSGYDLLPGYWGVGDDCLLGTDKGYPIRGIDFTNGGFLIICSDSIDAIGDININGIRYEVADAVMYTNYFIEGLSAFYGHVEASIAASDVNADGITLSVSDLVYLVRVVVGDALPYAKLTPGVDNINVATQLVGSDMAVTYDASTDIGAMLMIYKIDGTIGEPTLGSGAADMNIVYGIAGNELRVLIYNIGKNAILGGRHDLVNIPVDGSLELKSVEVADYFGNAMEASVRVLPTTFDLAQNYPNPFNPTTTIELSLPVASDYNVVIYNIAGQLIRTYNGSAEAGVVEVVWDGRDASGNQVASGMYFYKGTASHFSATKKMILMK